VALLRYPQEIDALTMDPNQLMTAFVGGFVAVLLYRTWRMMK
jgi:hypothetical protein